MENYTTMSSTTNTVPVCEKAVSKENITQIVMETREIQIANKDMVAKIVNHLAGPELVKEFESPESSEQCLIDSVMNHRIIAKQINTALNIICMALGV